MGCRWIYPPSILCANIRSTKGTSPFVFSFCVFGLWVDDRCLPDVDDPECPQCAKENATIRDLRRQQDEWAERQDLFRAHLKDSDDKFGVVAKWFGKGVMNSIKLVDM